MHSYATGLWYAANDVSTVYCSLKLDLCRLCGTHLKQLTWAFLKSVSCSPLGASVGQCVGAWFVLSVQWDRCMVYIDRFKLLIFGVQYRSAYKQYSLNNRIYLSDAQDD